VNHKRVYRLYSEEGLSIRTKLPRRKRAWRYWTGRSEIAAPNDGWARVRGKTKSDLIPENWIV